MLRELIMAGALALGGAPAHPRPLIPVIDRIQTTKHIAFITIDDGYVRDPRVLSYLRRQHIPVTAFLHTVAVAHGHGGVDYFRQLRADGSRLEDHSVTHPHLAGLSFAQQRSEICTAATTEEHWFGHRPHLFRPPYGSWDDTTRRAAASCGIHALVLWTAEFTDGRSAIQGGMLKPGMIVLLHWHKDLLSDLERTVAALKKAGLKPELLEANDGGA